MSGIAIGRLLRSGTTGFVIGCRVNQLDAPSFGALVRVPLAANYQVYGLIYDIHIEDDGLVRQLITAQDVPEEVLRDNRENRNVPVEIAVLALGYQKGSQIFHLLPPRPPLSLDAIYLCSSEEIVRFTGTGRLAAHLLAAREAQESAGNIDWFEAALQELITLMRDDYQGLMNVLSAASEI